MQTIKDTIPIKRLRYIRRGLQTGVPKKELLESLNKKAVQMEDVKGLSKYFRRINYHCTKDVFFYELDENIWRYSEKKVVDNITVDYGLIIDGSINSLMWDEKLKKMLVNLSKKICNANSNNDFIVNCFTHIIDRPSESFKDSLQRILFINQLLWQTEHTLVGLGRLDKILYNRYSYDISENAITKDEAKYLITEFLKTLHKFYEFKSNSLKGDTGQIIILGGMNQDGSYLFNDLTTLFLEAVSELHLPDPKILLRVCKKTPDELWELSLKCISTGIGCPLFSNDEIVIPALQEIGYDTIDSYNYGTSACWEPLVIGDSFDQNNAGNLVLPDLLNEVVGKKEYIDFEDLLDELAASIKKKFIKINESMNTTKYATDPIQAMFIDGSRNKKSISIKDAKYVYYSVLITGFSNCINGLLAIKNMVFNERAYTLKEFDALRQEGFSEDIWDRIDKLSQFGCDEEEVITLTNTVIKFFQIATKEANQKYGYMTRFGLSSPSYMTSGVNSEASFDGRKEHSAFNVHISSNKSVAFTELMNFASALDYSGGCVNGNVVDFIVNPSMIKQNMEKFVQLVKIGMLNGCFQMQMNVLSSAQLIDAKKHPEKHTGLIVRVWGFSAYFNDLPEEYQTLLINRALISEGVAV